MKALRLPTSFRAMVAKVSGVKRGKLGSSSLPSTLTTSPIWNTPGFTRPTMSPGYASSTFSRSWANRVCACESRSLRPVRVWVTSMPRSKCPDITRM